MLKLSALPRLPQICPWCLQWFFSHLVPHLLSDNHTNHKGQDHLLETQRTKTPAEFTEEVSALNKKGRLRNNIRALERKDRLIVPARRGRKSEKSDTSDHVWCRLCQSAVTKKGYRDSHLKICARAKKVTISTDVHKQLTKSAVAVLEPEDVTIKRYLENKPPVFLEVLLEIRNDRLALTMFVLEDDVANALVSRMVSDGRSKGTWVAKIRTWLRMLFTVFKYFKSVYGESCKSVLDMLDYDLWHAPVTVGKHTYPAIVAACYVACGKEVDKDNFKSCNDVMLFSSLFQRVADIILNQIHHTAETLATWRERGRSFGDYMSSDTWRTFTVRPAARQKAKANNFKSVLVPPKDFKHYLGHVEEMARVACTALRDAWSRKDRNACIKALALVIESLPLAIGAFSYRRASEPFRFRTYDVTGRPQLDKLLKDHSHILSSGADKEICKFAIVESKGKGDNPVLTVIKIVFMSDLDLLCDVQFRAFVGVPEENDFVFPSLRSRDGMGHAHPTRCQAKYAKQCENDVTNHKELRSRYFRTTFATNLCNMNLTYQTKKLLCALMGHNLAVHEQYYNVPQPLQMAAYMGFACEASADDKIRGLSATTLEEQVDKRAPTMTTPANATDDMLVFKFFTAHFAVPIFKLVMYNELFCINYLLLTFLLCSTIAQILEEVEQTCMEDFNEECDDEADMPEELPTQYIHC